MNILKPQKMLFDNLRTIENLQSELIENDELENVKIKDYSTSNLEVLMLLAIRQYLIMFL